MKLYDVLKGAYANYKVCDANDADLYSVAVRVNNFYVVFIIFCPQLLANCQLVFFYTFGLVFSNTYCTQLEGHVVSAVTTEPEMPEASTRWKN